MKLIIVWLGCVLAFFIALKNPPAAYVDKSRKCLVLDKLDKVTGKYPRTEFILVMQELETNKIFDLEVSPATWSQAEVAEVLIFDLNNQEIDFKPSEQWQEIAYGFALIFSAIGGIGGLGWILWRLTLKKKS